MPIGMLHEIDTNAQSQVSPLFQYYLMRELKTDITLTAPVGIGDSVVNVSAGHGFTTGATPSTIVIWEGSRFLQSDVFGVATNAITINMPSYVEFTTSAKVVRGVTNMAIDGTTPAEFIFNPYLSQVPIDINKVVISMLHATDGDDGKFGGIAALTNGFYFRRANGVIQNLGNHRSNQSFRDYGYIVDYPTKAPSGTYATVVTKIIEDSHDQAVRVDPRRSDYIKAVVRDNLLTLTKLTVSTLGSYTSGE